MACPAAVVYVDSEVEFIAGNGTRKHILKTPKVQQMLESCDITPVKFTSSAPGE